MPELHPEPTFAAIVRTTGARPALLAEALASLTYQTHSCLAVVVVHGSNDALMETTTQCRQLRGLRFETLHAPEQHRNRGYPLNVGIEYCCRSLPDLTYVCFLDDDHVLYPFFTEVMASTFRTTAADLFYCASNRRDREPTVTAGVTPKPIPYLFVENFIAGNGFAVRLEALRRASLRFREDIDSDEDWLFLVQAVERGLLFQPAMATLSEFSADSSSQPDADERSRTSQLVREHINRSLFPIPGAQLVAIAREMETMPDSARLHKSIAGGESQTRIRELERRVFDLEQSLSWKFTMPLRVVAGWLFSIRAGIRRG